MEHFFAPKGYRSALDVHDTQIAIGKIKNIFQANLSRALDLSRVTAPLFVRSNTGINDDLNGVERPVAFDVADYDGRAEVVHSLAKWKRVALKKYGFPPLTGLYADMNAIRRDELRDNLHSVYVDQWDWEKVILREHRNLAFLKETVEKIVGAIADTADEIRALYPALTVKIERKPAFVTAQELEDRYPSLTPKQREDAFLREHKTAFIIGIGGKMKSGERHDGRAPDYDDWTLNGDILFYNELLDCAFEVSSMGIRVDEAALEKQLKEANAEARKELAFHKALLAEELPLSIGGGIGQSRLCMLLLGKAHIGEVQCSVWDEETVREAREAGIHIL